MRRLRDISQLEPSVGAIVNAGTSSEGVVFSKPRDTQPPRTIEKDRSMGGDRDPAPRTRTVLPPVNDRESLAMDAIGGRCASIQSNCVTSARAKALAPTRSTN